MDDLNFYPAAVNSARQLRRGHAADFDDLVQEGVIAAWQATRETERRDPQVYGNVVASRRISRVMEGRVPMTGSERPGQKTYEPTRRADRVAPLAALEDRTVRGPDIGSRDAVSAAIRALPHEEDRYAVWLLFWQEYTRAEVAEELGIAVEALNKRWSARIAPALRLLLEGSR